MPPRPDIVGGGYTAKKSKPKAKKVVRRPAPKAPVSTGRGAGAAAGQANPHPSMVSDSQRASDKKQAAARKVPGRSVGAAAGKAAPALSKKQRADVERDARKSETADGQLHRALEGLVDGGAKARVVVPKEKHKTVGGLVHNAGRNLKDIVTGLPASAVTMTKAVGEEVLNAGSGVARSHSQAAPPKRPGVKPIVKAIKEKDPAYALGEAAVKTIRGDSKGAKRALKRAGDNAYDRPLDAVAEAAGGAGAAGRAASIIKHGHTDEVRVAQARPPRRVEHEPAPVTKRDVQARRSAAKAEVRVRQGKGSAADEAHVARITRKPTVRKEQRYSSSPVVRTIQKGRENRAGTKGRDPFVATPKQAKRMNKKRFDEESRNKHAGGLYREAQAAEQAHRDLKALGKDPAKHAAAQLLVNDRVRPGREAADLAALHRTAAAREGGDHNARILATVKVEHLTDPKVRVVAAAKAEGLRLSEARLKGEGFFEGRDGKGTNPELVAKMQPHLARGTIRQVDEGDKVHVTRQRQEPPRPVKVAQEPPPPPTRAGQQPSAPVKAVATPAVVDELAAVATRLKVVEHEIAARNFAAKQKLRHGYRANDAPGAKVVGRGKRKRVFNDNAEFSSRKKMAELRAERTQLRRRVEQLRAKQVVGAQPKVSKIDTSAKVVPGRGTGSVKKTLTGKEGAKRPADSLSPDQLGAVAARENERVRMMDPAKVSARVEAAKAAGIEPHPADVRALAGGSEKSAAEPAVSEVTPGVSPAAAEHGKPGDKQQNGQGNEPRVANEPVDHAGSVPKVEAVHNGTSVRATRKGYVWTEGPHAGKYVEEAHLDGEQGAFIRGLDHAAHHTEDLQQPRAGHGYSAEDAILGNLSEDRVLSTRLDRERQITLIRLAKSVEENFAYRTSKGQTRFAQARAVELAGRRGKGWTTLNVNKTEAIIVPKEIGQRWKQQINPPSRTERIGRYVTRQFVRTVLPFSVTWQAGNVADLYTRLVATDARFAVPGLAGSSGRDLVAAVETALRKTDPHLADELTQSLKGHFGARSTVKPLKFSGITEDAKSQLVRSAGEWISSNRDRRVIKQVADVGRGATDKLFSAGTKAESAMVSRAAGSAMQNYARALGHDVADHVALAQKLAGEFKDDPAKLLEFQRRTLEITGDYVTRGPRIKLTQHVAVPFVQWIKAANKFVFHTLPVGHPYKTAMMLWAASVTEPERRRLGLSNYITEAEAKKLGLPAPQNGYLAGAPKILPGGHRLPVSPLTSFGEAARWVEGIEGAAHGDEKILTEPVVPFLQRPARSGLDYGPAVGGDRLADAFVPGHKQVKRALEGERPHPRSTLQHPIGTGDKSTEARILAAMTVPMGREFPEPRAKAGSSDRVRRVPIGGTFPFEVRGPDGKKKTIYLTRTH